MNERLPAVTPRQLMKVMEQLGWQLHRVRGSHYMMMHPIEHRVIPLPMHNGELKRGTLLGILRSAGIDKDGLRKLLR